MGRQIYFAPIDLVEDRARTRVVGVAVMTAVYKTRPKTGSGVCLCCCLLASGCIAEQTWGKVGSLASGQGAIPTPTFCWHQPSADSILMCMSHFPRSAGSLLHLPVLRRHALSRVGPTSGRRSQTRQGATQWLPATPAPLATPLLLGLCTDFATHFVRVTVGLRRLQLHWGSRRPALHCEHAGALGHIHSNQPNSWPWPPPSRPACPASSA